MNSAGWQHRLPFHYAWLVLATAALTVLASIGLARFALGMILPSMAAALGLDYAQMGWIGTANFCGYFLAVLLVGPLTRGLSARALAAAGLALVAVSLAVLGQASAYRWIVAAYALTGFGSGLANMMAMGLLSAWFEARYRGRAAGIAVAGNGLAILVAGALVPLLVTLDPARGWRWAWMAIAAVSAAVGLLGLWIQRDRPGQLGLSALDARSAPAAAPAAGAGAAPGAPSRRALRHLGLVYFGFGFTYVIYATFIVTRLVAEHGMSQVEAGRFWSWVGALSLVSTPLFGALSDRIGRRRSLVLVLALQALAYGVSALPANPWSVYVSVALFGLTAWSVPGIMAAAAGDVMGPARAAAGLAFLTLFFGVGQIAGPALGGWLANAADSFQAAFALAAVMAGVAAILAHRLPVNR